MPQLDPVVRVSTDLDAGRTARWDDNLTDRIIAFSFTDKARGADEISITFRNNDGKLLDDTRLSPDQRLLILYGYPHLSRTARLTIKKVEGFWRFTVKGPANGADRFLGSQRNRTFADATEWEVAEEIATGLGFTTDESRVIDAGDIAEIRRGMTQANETDWAFLTRLADRVDCVVYVRDGVFHFHAPSLDARPIKEYVFFDGDGSSFIEPPKIEYGVVGRSGRVDAHGVSTEERAEVSGSASNTTDPDRQALGENLALRDADAIYNSVLDRELGFTPPGPGGEDGGQRSVMTTPAQSDDEAQRAARRRFRGAERESVKLEGMLVGDPEAIADETVAISGIGQRFSGPYLLDEVTHDIGEGGYKTKIKGRRNAVSRSRSARRGADGRSADQPREEADVLYDRATDEMLGLVNRGEPGSSQWDGWPSGGLGDE